MGEETHIIPLTVAGVVLKKDGKYLLVQEKKPTAYGLWCLPGGRVDTGDTIEKAAVREAKEETGYDVKLIRKLGVFQDKDKEPLKHLFEAEIIGGELSFPRNEILDVRWFSIEAIRDIKGQLRGLSIIQAIEAFEGKHF